jgi:hypothetical protein
MKAISRLRTNHHRPEGPPIQDDDRQDRAELDDDVEHLPPRVIIPQQRTRQDQVAGGGHRQEFGDTLDNPEDDGGNQIVHASPQC